MVVRGRAKHAPTASLEGRLFMKRVFLIVLDSVGIGAAPDAAEFGDAGAHTLRSVSKSPKFSVENLKKAGLGNISGLAFLGKTETPRIDTVAPIVYALGGSMDEMLNPAMNKDELKETSVMALKDSFEFQLAMQKETTELHINNIRAHYEQHREDFKENIDKLLESKDDVIKSLKILCLTLSIVLGLCLFILVGLLIIEVMNPNLG